MRNDFFQFTWTSVTESKSSTECSNQCPPGVSSNLNCSVNCYKLSPRASGGVCWFAINSRIRNCAIHTIGCFQTHLQAPRKPVLTLGSAAADLLTCVKQCVRLFRLQKFFHALTALLNNYFRCTLVLSIEAIQNGLALYEQVVNLSLFLKSAHNNAVIWSHWDSSWKQKRSCFSFSCFLLSVERRQTRDTGLYS